MDENLLEQKISLIPTQKLKRWAIDAVEDCGRQLGQKLDATECNYIAEKFYKEMRTKGGWYLNEFQHVLDNGVRGYYKGVNSSKITVSKLLSWIAERTSQRSRIEASKTVEKAEEIQAGSKNNGLMGKVFSQLFILSAKYPRQAEATRGHIETDANGRQAIVGNKLREIANYVANGGTVEQYLKEMQL